jgi:hypothetical protein
MTSIGGYRQPHEGGRRDARAARRNHRHAYLMSTCATFSRQNGRLHESVDDSFTGTELPLVVEARRSEGAKHPAVM